MPKAIGTAKTRSCETVDMTVGEANLYNVLCVNEDVRLEDGNESEDGDDVSLMSSRAGSVLAVEEDSDDEEEVPSESSIEETLRHMANVRKKKMSSLIMKDLLGADGNAATVTMKRSHEKEKARLAKKEVLVKVANRQFEIKMQSRMMNLEKKCAQSKSKTYVQHNFKWRKQFNQSIQKKRTSYSSSGGNKK